MYILDRVDVLDLSHTQNIGTMLKTHFSGSQFIVVSLKEGMSNNANVIFRTRFIDGVSCVIRTIGKGTKGGAAALPPPPEETTKKVTNKKKTAAKKTEKENKTSQLVK